MSGILDAMKEIGKGMLDIKETAAFWQSVISDKKVNKEEVGTLEALGTVAGVGLAPALVVGAAAYAVPVLVGSTVGKAVTAGGLLIIAACGDEITTTEPVTTDGGTEDKKVTAEGVDFILAADPTQGLDQEISFEVPVTASKPLKNVTLEVGLKPDYINPRNEQEISFPESFENGIPPLFVEPDQEYASLEITAEAAIPTSENYPTIELWARKVGKDSVEVNWTAIDNASSYSIFTYKDVDGGLELLDTELVTVSDPALSEYRFTILNLSSNTEYKFQVKTTIEDTEYASEVVPVETHWITNESELPYAFNDDSYQAPSLSNLEVAAVGSTYVKATWNRADGAAIYQACISDEVEPLHCEITTNDAITFTGVPGGLIPESTYTIGVTAYPGYLFNVPAYSGIDLANSDYLASLEVPELSYNLDGAEEDVAIECEDLSKGCSVTIDNVNQGVILSGKLKVTIPAYLGDSAQIGYDPYALNGKVGIPLQVKVEGETNE